ncbi:putative cyclase [Prauserella shujinwangii]|uniref:Putative cyclase n=1 Tax=Prauserella shujinwangii TaxID=1453103 RepID=A0A2T0LT95_9PSEU|nr:cyclase family protein [Prauserella shujinwangii]PRX46957.1 putative cyclase [Prauserella shujinwangii]
MTALADLPDYAALRRRTDAPPGSSWGLFGAGDQAGTLNFLALNDLPGAAREVREGTAFSLDLPSTAISPSLAPTRRPIEHHVFQRTPFHRDEWLDSFYPQYGSQLDGLRHIGHPEHGFYNGADARRFVPGDELLSIHHLADLPIAGRAVLLDVDRHLRARGRPIDARSSRAITARELEDTRAAQGTQVRPGDIVLIRFGWLRWYLHEADPHVRESLRTVQRHPGLAQSHDVLAWLWDHRVSLVAGDNFALECWPAAPSSPFFTRAERDEGARDPHSGIMHRALIGLLGMPLGELWHLDPLADACAADERWSFLLTVSPLSIVGGVGSPANAMALR